MASIINASTAGAGGLITTADNSGTLQLQTASTTAMTINSSQVVNFANSPTIAGSAFPSGAMTLISTLTASNSPSLEWTGLTGNYYMLKIEYLSTYSGGNQYTYLQFGSGSGPTYATSGYSLGAQYNGASGAFYSLSGSGTGIDFTQNKNVLGNLSGTFFIESGSGLDNPNVNGMYGQGNTQNCTLWGKSPSLGGTLTAIRLILATNNIQSGKASLYAIST